MQSWRIYHKHLLRIDPGEEVVSSLLEFFKEKGLKFGTITGTGLAKNLVLLSDDGEATLNIAEETSVKVLSGNINWQHNGPEILFVATLTDGQQLRIIEAWAAKPWEVIIDPLEVDVER